MHHNTKHICYAAITTAVIMESMLSIDKLLEGNKT